MQSVSLDLIWASATSDPKKDRIIPESVLKKANNWEEDVTELHLNLHMIRKIENFEPLTNIKYLDLSANNIDTIENLGSLTQLQHLDLGSNYICFLSAIEELEDLIFLESLDLSGNPCSFFNDYYLYVIAALPQLNSVDKRTTNPSERIKALENFDDLEESIENQEENVRKKRRLQKMRSFYKCKAMLKYSHLALEQLDDIFNEAIYVEKDPLKLERDLAEMQLLPSMQIYPGKRLPYKHQRVLFGNLNMPLNVNEGRFKFRFGDTEYGNGYILQVTLSNDIPTSSIDVNVHDTYVRVMAEGWILQLALPYPINIDKATTERNQLTSTMKITMPKIDTRPTKIVYKMSPAQKQLCYKMKPVYETRTFGEATKSFLSLHIIRTEEMERATFTQIIPDIGTSSLYRGLYRGQ